MRALGIDVGVGKGLDLVLLDERRVPFLVVPRAGLDDVERVVREGKPDIVAIDSPPRWARDGPSRATENELARLNIHAFRTPSAAHGKADDVRLDAAWAWRSSARSSGSGSRARPRGRGRVARSRSSRTRPPPCSPGCLSPKGDAQTRVA